MTERVRLAFGVAALSVIVLAAGCQTTKKPPEPAPLAPIAGEGFQPVAPVSAVHIEEGRYPNLYAPGTYAIWVDENVAAAKLQREQQAGGVIPPTLASDAEFIARNYYVVELHLESMFPDASIAYDVVGLRNMDVYLSLPDGSQTRPIQRVLGTHASEDQQGALKQFGRTNIIVFPRQELILGQATVPREAPGVRLVVQGFNTTFYFDWAAAQQPQAVPPDQAGPTSFSALYSKLRDLAHMFQ